MRSCLLAAVILVTACHHDCITIPGCPPPIAARVSVTSAVTHAGLSGVTMRINGDSVNVVACDQGCLVPGHAGAYDIEIAAPGFQTVDRKFNVTGSEKSVPVSGPGGFEGNSCGCEVVNTQQIAVALIPLT